MIDFEPIGYIKTNYHKDPPRQPYEDDKGHYLIIEDKYKAALTGLEKYNYIYVIFYLDKIKSNRVRSVITKANREVGLFATRTPYRPNPIGLSIVKIQSVAENRIYISGIDALDGTPVLDLKPYVKGLDDKQDANRGWVEGQRYPDDLLIVYTDGACTGNPGPGGYAALIISGNQEQEIAGYHPETTNNRMELLAVIEGLKEIEPGSKVRLVSDSNYVLKGLTDWLRNWKRNDWKTASNRPVKNLDLWQQLDRLKDNYQLEYIKVKGHSGDKYNERVDSLAKEQIKRNYKK